MYWLTFEELLPVVTVGVFCALCSITQIKAAKASAVNFYSAVDVKGCIFCFSL
jgi:hypothetical protein